MIWMFRYWKRLLGFYKVGVAPGKSESVAITISMDDLALYDLQLAYRVIPGVYTVYISDSSTIVSESATFEIS